MLLASVHEIPATLPISCPARGYDWLRTRGWAAIVAGGVNEAEAPTPLIMEGLVVIAHAGQVRQEV